MTEPDLQISAEERLLVKLSRVRPEPSVEEADFDRVDPARLLYIAGRLGNFSLVARRYLSLAPRLSAEVRARIQRNLAHYEVREAFQLADMRDLALALASAREPLLLLKGAAYTSFIYPSRGIRNYQDMDVLVRPTAVPGVVAALRRLGYGPHHEIEGSVDLVRHLGKGLPSLLVEVHTELVHHHEYPFYRADLAFQERRFVERAERRELDGAPVLILKAEDELLYSVLHAFFHHDMAGIKYHSDLNALLTDPNRPLDCEEAIATARQARAGYAVGLMLLVQRALFGREAVPEALIAGLAPSGARLWALRRLLPPLVRVALSEGRVAGHPVKVLVAPGGIGPALLGLRWLFPGRRYLEAYYGHQGQPWRAAYHLRYPAEILQKAIRRQAVGSAPARD